MTRRPVLERARRLLRARRFPAAIRLLEEALDSGGDYRKSFDFFYILGAACLYSGDAGAANDYFNKARAIRMRDTRLLSAQGALLLRRGETARAVEYFLDALDSDSGNRTARRALRFIRTHGDAETIARWAETGKIARFYPPLGAPPAVKALAAAAALGAAAAAFAVFALPRLPPLSAFSAPASGARAGAEGALTLTAEERQHPLEEDASRSVYRYLLSGKEAAASYEAAKRYFEEYRDNAAQVEINRLLNSNAALSIKQKARILMGFLQEPSFDSLKDNYGCREAAADPALYADCFAVWEGRVSNLRDEGGEARCDLLVGYDPQKSQTVEGIVPLVFAPGAQAGIDPALPVRVLGKITLEDKRLLLRVKSVYQPLR